MQLVNDEHAGLYATKYVHGKTLKVRLACASAVPAHASCPQLVEERGIEPRDGRITWHLDDDHRDHLGIGALPCIGRRGVIAAEALDKCGFAVVAGRHEERIGRPHPARPVHEELV